MSAHAIRIVEEEIARVRQGLGDLSGTYSGHGVNDRLDSLGVRIKERIEQECIEIEPCNHCQAELPVDTFLVQDTHCDPPRKQNLCEGCYEGLREDGFRVEVYTPPKPQPEQVSPAEDDIPF